MGNYTEESVSFPGKYAKIGLLFELMLLEQPNETCDQTLVPYY